MGDESTRPRSRGGLAGGHRHPRPAVQPL